MALQMNYTDETGTNHSVSYWEIMKLNINRVVATSAGANVEAEIHGWHSKADFDSGKQVIKTKFYRISNQTINFNNTTLQAFNNMYAFAIASPEPGGLPSFFATATIV